MKTNKITRELAMEWWNSLNYQSTKVNYFNRHFINRHFATLTGSEIEKMWENEVPLEVRESYYGVYNKPNNIKTIFTINNQPVLDITTLDVSKDSPNYGAKFGTNRDRNPDTDWNELRSTNMSNAKEVELTEELKQILLEDLAYAYGNRTSKFTEKLKEFGFIK